MSAKLAAMCGLYCGVCEFKENQKCPGCLESRGSVFWGTCPVAVCCIEKEVEECCQCKDFCCAKLNELSFNSKHSDNGKRIKNLEDRWLEGTEEWVKKCYIKAEKAKPPKKKAKKK